MIYKVIGNASHGAIETGTMGETETSTRGGKTKEDTMDTVTETVTRKSSSKIQKGTNMKQVSTTKLQMANTAKRR